ncbi:MAG TPA: BlaI/MecI/CopY family transcriptional regulator [Pirellulaceae bacterium]|nr:BlaI/MecI/CopY family transcriptional regulator [Pirellulaceae bacterium]
MPRPPQDVTEAELSILNVLWERGQATVRELAEELYDKKSSPSQHATVQKLLERLEAKDCVTRDHDSWPYTFAPAIDRGDLIGRQLQQTADKLTGGSLRPILIHLVKAGLSARDRKTLRGLLDQGTPKSKRRGKKK